MRAPTFNPGTAADHDVSVGPSQDRRRDGQGLKSYANLNRHLIAAGLSSLYRLWLICRALDPDGRGVVSMDALREQLQAVGLDQNHIRCARADSQSHVFFTFHQHKVEYRALEAVCVALGVAPGRGIYIPPESVANTESFRAALYAAWIASHDELHISRERLTALFKVSADTLRRWERLTGVVVTYNVVAVDPSDAAAAVAYIPRDARLDHLDRLGHSYTWHYQGATYYRTVNRYQAPHYARGRVGNTKKIATVVRQAGMPVSDHGDGTEQAGPRRRVFFTARATPKPYQEQAGASLRATQRVIETAPGRAALWRFSQRRPVARQQALALGH